MENLTHPIPPNKSEGCYVCGQGLDEILISKLVSGMSLALCKKHQFITSAPQKYQKPA